MAQLIKIKKGLDINLKGKAKNIVLKPLKSKLYCINPDDFIGLVPKILIKIGDKVQAGTALICDKKHSSVKVVSPVSGEVVEINRGEKRKLLSIIIEADDETDYLDFGRKKVSDLSADDIVQGLSQAGILPFIRQRPYDIVANPEDSPRDIFISGFYSAPLSPDLEFILKGEEKDFQTGLDALAKLTKGKVHLGLNNHCVIAALKYAKHVEINTFEGPHPSGNVGVQINKIKAIDKGETVWVINPADVLFIGRLFNKGIADFSRLIALTGSEVKETGYHKTIIGVNIQDIVKDNVSTELNLRYISGNVLTGAKISEQGYLRATDNQVTVIPEGDDNNEFFGWASLGLDKFSNSRTYFSWILNPLGSKEYQIDARIKGGTRAMIMSDEYDKVFPMDIYPEFLLKAIIAFNVDKMEALGIYEVAPEDFALCEFVDTSKIEIQKIVRMGLDLLYKEMND